MNEVEELSKLDPAGLPPLKPVLLDDLYQSVLKNLHLELVRGLQASKYGADAWTFRTRPDPR